MDGPVGEEQAEGATDQDEKQTFGDELAHEADAGGAESVADSDFAFARFRADQQQTGDVDASDDEQKSSTSKEHKKQRAEGADDSFSKNLDVGALTGVGVRILLGELGSDVFEFREGRLHGDAVSHAANAVKTMATAAKIASA